jgi:hypothetical protein
MPLTDHVAATPRRRRVGAAPSSREKNRAPFDLPGKLATRRRHHLLRRGHRSYEDCGFAAQRHGSGLINHLCNRTAVATRRRRTNAKTLLGLSLGILLMMVSYPPLSAQIAFSITNLPSQIGDYHRAYVDTNAVNVSTLLGQPGGPQQWDFSQPRGVNEFIQRMDVVSPTDGANAASFPQATYAERLTSESDGTCSWSYYQIITNEGRAYYGFVDTNSNPEMPIKVFDSPTIDLPATIQFEQTWNRTADYQDFAVFITFAVHFTAQASVDAYGTLLLPEIGEVPALRVNEVHEYDYIDETLGIANYTNYFRYYYWLVPGIGKAVEIISEPDSTGPPPENLTTAGTLSRVFRASGVQPAPYPVANLRIHFQDGQAMLDWNVETNALSYQVEAISNLGTNNWQLAGEPATNAWSEPATNAERFFRVFAQP